MSQVFSGAGVALVTPFKNNSEIDFPALEQVVENQIANGIDYLVALGTTAETPTLSEEEKAEVVACVREKAAGRVPLVVGAGGNDTRAMLSKWEKLDCRGVDALLVVTPYYNKPGQEGLFRHYSELAKSAPAPVILYNVPSRTGINLEADTTIRLAQHSEKIIAIKEASGLIPQISKIIQHAPAGFSVISGDDVMALPIIALGGKGVISVIANALPRELSNLVQAALIGDYATARRFHFDLLNLFGLQFSDGNPAGVKAMLAHMGVIENVLRLPLTPATHKTEQQIIEALKKLH